MTLTPPRSILFPYTTLFRSRLPGRIDRLVGDVDGPVNIRERPGLLAPECRREDDVGELRRLGQEGILDDDEQVRLLQNLADPRSEEHTSELQSRQYLVCRLL